MTDETYDPNQDPAVGRQDQEAEPGAEPPKTDPIQEAVDAVTDAVSHLQEVTRPDTVDTGPGDAPGADDGE